MVEECNLKNGGQHFWVSLYEYSKNGQRIFVFYCPTCDQTKTKSFEEIVEESNIPIW